MEKLSIAINGFGRIGRCIARAIYQRQDMELVAINDPCDWSILSYLLEFDSTHGKFPKKVEYTQNGIFIDGRKIRLSRREREADFGNVDIVIESSGLFLKKSCVSHHLKNGAKKVILSAPPEDDTPTIVMGVNQEDYKGEEIVSNASCTTNCLAPLCKIIDTHFGIESGLITTIHSYTSDQRLLDNAHPRDKRRSRSAAMNIVPTTTRAARNLYRVLPKLKGILHGHSTRVPVVDVSMLDLNIITKEPIKDLIQLLHTYSKGSMKNILRIDLDYGVSSDFLGDTHSCIVPEDLIFNINNHLKIMAWYDNETGYSNRILDLARYITWGH